MVQPPGRRDEHAGLSLSARESIAARAETGGVRRLVHSAFGPSPRAFGLACTVHRSPAVQRRLRTMGRRRNVGHRPEDFARASEAIHAGHGNGKTSSARNGHSPFVGAACVGVVPRRRTGYHGPCPYGTRRPCLVHTRQNHRSSQRCRRSRRPSLPPGCSRRSRSARVPGRSGRRSHRHRSHG